MDESGPTSEEDRPHSGSESLPSATCDTTDLSKAVCYNCRQLGHLSAKCTAARTPRNQQPAGFKTNAPAMSCLQNSEPLEGSMVQCAVVQADVPTIGKVDAFPDSGSKLTILSQELIGILSLLPWTKPPIAVVGGSTVVPAGTLSTRISVAPIAAVVEVVVLARNALPLILGEDWFEAAHAELVVRPPNTTEIRHPSSGAVLLCQEKKITTWDSMKEHSTPLASFQTLCLTVGNRIGMLLMTDSSWSRKLKSS
ncbi:hypothetical protein HPB47_014263 [Ixodes persulcatus]|uniref:Uncharacterized protein n=1 Tax=Ixodes persulcatus TaxID=34615 RepID=A0AC60R010_IXOPE|nr:hypothetical protein HPB47_014263 [Ixodes persulcatus]